ncbi:MAG: hypothetical protein ACK5JM_03280 [Rhodoblastus sp.]
MKPVPANPALLLRCADAAGYAAVSGYDDDYPVAYAKKHNGFWCAVLSIFFVIL